VSAPPTFSLVVCTLGTTPYLFDGLQSMLAQVGAAEVVVVHSGGGVGRPLPDDVVDLLSAHGARIEVEPAVGLARARQRGLEAAGGDFVVFGDDDVLVSAGWWDAMVAAASSRPGIGSVGGRIVPSWPDGGTGPSWLPSALRSYFGERLAAPGAEGATPPPPYGANMAVARGPALSAGGGFSEGLGHRGRSRGLHEDTELCLRLAAAGYPMVDAPGAVLHHRIKPEQVRVGWVMRRAWAQGRSDRRRDGLWGHSSTGLRATKLVGLVASLPLGVLRLRFGVYVLARILVNVGYLYETVVGSRQIGVAEREVPPSPAGGQALGASAEGHHDG
jgi:GT2 family glycosyltransferase